MTFSGKYSLQLPEGWMADAQEDKSLKGVGTGDVMLFGAKAWPSEMSPAEYMEKTLGNTEKKPGYKLIEKTAIKTNPDRKAQRLRYQINGEDGPVSFVKFYCQLSDTEVVVLLFMLRNFSSVAAKNDIEAIFNSVKIATSADQDNSWATPSAEKPKESSKTTAVNVGGYSLQLPAGWKVIEEKDKSFSAGEPGGMSLNAFVISTALTPEENMQKIITGTLEKKPGYKFLEKGSVKNRAGHQGCFVRYQKDATSGRVWVDYYFQVADKQNMILVFGYPGANSTSVKSVIEAIFNSVKVAAASKP